MKIRYRIISQLAQFQKKIVKPPQRECTLIRIYEYNSYNIQSLTRMGTKSHCDWMPSYQAYGITYWFLYGNIFSMTEYKEVLPPSPTNHSFKIGNFIEIKDLRPQPHWLSSSDE